MGVLFLFLRLALGLIVQVQPSHDVSKSRAVDDAVPELDALARLLALSPLAQCLTIHGCSCNSSSGILFSGSSTRSYEKNSQLTVYSMPNFNKPNSPS